MDFKYPYTDFHELNLDWFLARFKELVETWNSVESDWNDLHDYVQNYFDNLNVQTEIDNKINAMILNGTFADIVSPFVTAALPALVAGQLPDVVAAQIGTVVANQIGSVVAAQLPAVAAQAAADEVSDWLAAHIDPDTGYVIDKSLTISDAAADAERTGTNINVLAASIDDLPSCKYHYGVNTDGKYLDANAVEQTMLGWSITPYFKIGKNPEYYIKTAITSNTPKTCFYDENKDFITGSGIKLNHAGNNKLLPPDNAVYVRFSVQTADAQDFQYSSVVLIDTVTPLDMSDAKLYDSFKTYMVMGELYDQTGVIVSSNAWARTKDLYKIDPESVIKIKDAFGVVLVEFDSNKDVVTYTNVGYSNTDTTVIADSNTEYIAVNATIANLSTFNCTVNDIPLGARYDVPWLVASSRDNLSIWYNKKYISHGDSITWQDGHTWASGPEQGLTAKGYQTIFSQNVGLASYDNQGKSGWSMAVVNGNGVVNTIKAVSDYSKFDLCTIACGTNDFKLNVPLGDLGIIGDTTFDDTTFYGAYRDAIEYILTNYPQIRIALLTPLQRDNAGYDVNHVNTAGYKLIDYVNAVKNLGSMYGLPVCDMYSESGFTKKTLSTYTLDGLHPNPTGYVRMGNYLTGFLNNIGN